MVTLFDTHCHLDFDLFDSDREEVLKRALDAGVTRILNPGIDLASSRAAVHLADTHPGVFAAVGVHPNEAKTWTASTLDELNELARHPKVVAVGEIGLDYYRDYAPRELQQQVLTRQLSLAAERGLPVIIHNRQAGGDILTLLSQWIAGLPDINPTLAGYPGVLHSFGEGLVVAQKAIALNFMIGITGPVTFRNAPELRQVIAQLPVGHLLIETDAPFLTPHPHRGKRNEPAYVRYVADKISEIYNLPVETVGSVTSANADRLFNRRVTA